MNNYPGTTDGAKTPQLLPAQAESPHHQVSKSAMNSAPPEAQSFAVANPSKSEFVHSAEQNKMQPPSDLHQRRHTTVPARSQIMAQEVPAQDRVDSQAALRQEEGKISINFAESVQDATQKHGDRPSILTISDTQIDGTSLFSQPRGGAPNNGSCRNQNYAFSYEQDNKGKNTRTARQHHGMTSVTEQRSQNVLSNFSQNQDAKLVPQDDSYLIGTCTEMAPSEPGFLEMSQQGPVKVEFSESEYDLNKKNDKQNQHLTQPITSENSSQRDFNATATFQAPCFTSEAVSQREETQELQSQPANDTNKDFVTEAFSHEQQRTHSQDSVVSVKNMTLSPIKEIQSPLKSINESGKLAFGIDLKKDSVNALGSENSHQNTRSAVDKGNLVQRDTDQSSEHPANQDSQQSSHLSQYFNQIVEDNDRVSVSKDVIIEKASDEDGGQNQDQNRDVMQIDGSQVPLPSRQFESEMFLEQSKESTDGPALSSQQLEYSRSNNMPSRASLVHGSVANVNDDIPWSLKGSAQKEITVVSLIEGTPQFHGSSPVILETNVEENPFQQQPNYESDTEVVNEHHNSSTSRRSQHHPRRTEASAISNTVPIEEHKEGDLYELKNDSIDILTQNSMYDPSKATPSSATYPKTIDGMMVEKVHSASQESVIKIINEDQKGENEDDSIRKSTNAYNISIPSALRMHNQTTDNGRGSSRFDKGHRDELDRVADRINRSFILNIEGGDENESFSIPNDINEQMPPRPARASQDSSLLPKHARSVSNQTNGSKKRTKKSRQQRVKTLVQQQPQDTSMTVREQGALPAINQEGNSSRRTAKQNEPVEEGGRQRFSTPRRGGSHSPRDMRDGTIDSTNDQNYPVEIRKHHVIRGPVLRNREDQQVIRNGKLQSKSQAAGKGKSRGGKQQEKLSKQQQITTTEESMQMSSNRQPEKKTLKRNVAKDQQTISNGSQSLSRSNENSSVCLPKKRIKRRAGRMVSQEDKNLQRDDGLKEKFKQLQKDSKNRQGKDVPVQFGSKKPTKWKNQTSSNGQYGSIRISQQNKNIIAKADTSLSEMAEHSLMSGLQPNNNAMSDFQYFEKGKISPKNPLAITLDNSTIDFQESNFRTANTNQISQQAISNMPIDRIYQELSKNWNKDQIMFEQRCQKVLNESKQEAAQQTTNMITSEEVRTRQQRFQLLKQRLLDNQSGNGSAQPAKIGRKKPNMGDQLAQQQAALNQNMRELDQMYSREEQKREKPRQIGQFQLIFNNPMERFNLPPSPSHSNPPNGGKAPAFVESNEYPISAHQSQIQLRQGNMYLSTNNGEQRQRSQVLSPSKLANSFLDASLPSQQVMAMNVIPHQMNQKILENQGNRYGAAKGAFFDHQSKSMNTTTQVNFRSGRAQNSTNYQISQQLPQRMQSVRAATANNAANKRNSNFTDPFNGSSGFKSSVSVNKRNLKVPQTNAPMTETRLPGLTPQSAGIDQSNLMQKLQYRSMRGRRIQEFLKQVQSQKLQDTDQTNKPEQEYQDMVEMPNDTQPMSQFSSGMPVHSQSSIRHEGGDYNGQPESRAILSNKLKATWGVNQSEADSNNSINQQRSATNSEWMSGQKLEKKSIISDRAVTGFDLDKQLPKITSSAMLNSFLAEQDKRIDFGFCLLYKKVRDGDNLDIDLDGGEFKALDLERLDSMMKFIKCKNQQTLTRPFQVRAHEECFNTIGMLLNELGMGYRARRMQRDDKQIDIERVYVMSCRAHKLHRARNELIKIFKMIKSLEDMLPRVKQLVMGKIAQQSSQKDPSIRNGPVQNGDSKMNEIVVNHADDEYIDLQIKSSELRKVLQNLVMTIPALIKNYKFFNNSFVFNDKDYLKYLSKEFIEVKGLLSVCNISF